MLKKLWKKSTPLFLALVLALGALCAAIPAGTAHAAGLTLTANASPSEMIAPGTVTITGTIKNDTAEEITGVSLWDVTTGTASEFSGAGASTMGPGDAYNLLRHRPAFRRAPSEHVAGQLARCTSGERQERFGRRIDE